MVLHLDVIVLHTHSFAQLYVCVLGLCALDSAFHKFVKLSVNLHNF